MGESTININPQSTDETVKRTNQFVEVLQEDLIAAIKDCVKAAAIGAQREPYSSRRSSEGESNTENRIAALERQIARQDKEIANLEAGVQNLRIAVNLLNETANRWH